VHALVGGLVSKALGGDFGTGAAAVGGATAAIALLKDQLDLLPDLSANERNAILQLAGDTVAYVVAGGGSQGAAAAGTAGMADLYNRQLHQDEKAAIKSHANGDSEEEARLTKAACYILKCWAQYAKDSEEYAQNYVSEAEVATLGNEINWVTSLQGNGFFNYSFLDKSADAILRDPTGVAVDVIKTAAGAIKTNVGVGLCLSSGAGCALGVPTAILGLSDTHEGIDSLSHRIENNDAPGFNPMRYWINSALPGLGNTAYDGANLALSLSSLGFQAPLKVGATDGITKTGSIFGVTVPKFSNQTIIPILNTVAPYGTTQSILILGVGSNTWSVIKDISDIWKKP
ncbi:hypothetical protein ACDA63_19935, partial [Uliginosibacterium sp. sgz301328]|uniref:hypothetical protein n=1 Tax=Uliginosibacterium sp. sgz301328 TaxID=3243764 RepID=UPI00359DA54A